MQIEYKFNSWEGNKDRFAWMSDQVGDYLEAMRMGFDEMLDTMRKAASEMPPRDKYRSVFENALGVAERMQTVTFHAEGEVKDALYGAGKAPAKATKAAPKKQATP